MKNTLLICLFLITMSTQAQETEFTFDIKRGMTDFVITSVDGKKAPEIYKNIIEWIKITYKSPDKVILSTIENEYIRFEGFSDNAYFVPSKYEIEISIKDNKYKFDLVSMQNYIDGIWKKNTIFHENMPTERASTFFKKDGSLNSFGKKIQQPVVYFNNLNKSISTYIINPVSDSNNKW